MLEERIKKGLQVTLLKSCQPFHLFGAFHHFEFLRHFNFKRTSNL